MARGGDGIGGIVKWGLILGGGYLGYKWWTGTAPAGVTTASATAVTSPPPPAAPAPPSGPSAAAVSTLNALYQAMVSAATAAKFA